MYALLHVSIDGLPNKGVVKIMQSLNNVIETVRHFVGLLLTGCSG